MTELAKRRVMTKAVADVENFRDKAMEYASKVVPPDMKGPFVAFVKNLVTNIPEDDLRGAFLTESLAPDALTSVKLVTKEVSTFGFLEFDSRDALQAAVLLDGKTVRGRKMVVDIATPEQIERMCKKGISPTSRGSPVFGRDTMGQQRFPSSASFGEMSRDAFGTEETTAMRAPRSTTSSNAPRPDVPVSRDMMGSSQPIEDGGRFGGMGGGRNRGSRGSNVSSPKTPFSGGDFSSGGGNWRDAPPAVAPAGNWRDTPAEVPTAVLKRDTSKDDVSSKPKRATPTTPAGGTWRDTPAEVPAGAPRQQPAAPKKTVETPAPEPKKVSVVKEGISWAAATKSN
eukprot:TRINITY_DN14796_c0_g1_i1.p1 TRINITY_DN14796_c0_g1~~TRINITY_DN14796_c0_g1_i1.p1  ORF type:complete len:341 (+),score=100.32 TRINITY_DN14796_c0_g1_i1:309-1331(+)